MNRIDEGFRNEIERARKHASNGDTALLAMALSAAQALAVYGNPLLLDEYGKADAALWKECGECAAKNRMAA